MDRQMLERRLKEYSDGACVMRTSQFAKFYGCRQDTASKMLASAEVEKVSGRWFIPSIVEKIMKGYM